MLLEFGDHSNDPYAAVNAAAWKVEFSNASDFGEEFCGRERLQPCRQQRTKTRL